MRIGSYLAGATTLLIAAVATLLVLVLASQERGRILDEKRGAAIAVTDLFAQSVSAGVVFHDSDSVESELGHLRTADGVRSAAVFETGRPTPVASFGNTLDAREEEDVDIGRETLVVTRRIDDRTGRPAGFVRIAFSLAKEHAAMAASLRSLIVGGVVVLLGVVFLLNALTSWRVVRPLRRLAAAAERIRHGDLSARAAFEGTDEIGTLASVFDLMGDAIAKREARLVGELEVAANIQTSVLPKTTDARGLEIAASMTPATEVGGDYYDVIPTEHGCWIGIGDVTGHGLGAGVVMLMLQSAIASLVRANPLASPAEVECTVNEVLYENIRRRMGRRDHATLSILRYDAGGMLSFAGAHEDIVVVRARTGDVERIETPGTWVGAMKDVSAATEDTSIQLEHDDLVVLYTDGVTEAMSPAGEQFGIERLTAVIRKARGASPHDVCRAITDAVTEWAGDPSDDVSVVVFRQTAPIAIEKRSSVAVSTREGT